MIKLAGSITILLIVIVYMDCCSAQNRAAPMKAGSNVSHGSETHNGTDPTCGLHSVIAAKLEVCARPLTSILEGTLEKWPRADNDIIGLCQSFAGSEKCIRDTGRRCAKGLQKVIISTLANSVQRARKRECTKQKYPALLKTTKCVESHNDILHLMIANATSRVSVVENQITNSEKKTNGLCCIIIEIENEIKRRLNPVCPAEATTIVKLYRSVIEDVDQIICLAPKCNNWHAGYKIPPMKPLDFGGIISSLMRVIFSLGE